MYHNDPKFSDRYAGANSADPDQTAHYSMVEPHSSNFRVITTNILGVQIFRKFMVVTLKFEQGCCTTKDADGMANSVDPDQTASGGAV